MKSRNKKTVYVGLSGGVDSSVSAYLLKKQGYNVVGVFMRQYDDSLGQTSVKASQVQCSWQQDRRDAIAAAAHLDIAFREWDFRKEYHKEVVDYMVSQYKAGKTPNPDVMCNNFVKFGAFLKKAISEDADYIATGHYVTIANSKGAMILNQAKDKNKDQTYFLWTLSQEQLQHCLFPLGSYTKPQVRVLAKKIGLPNWDKKDSQGVCFVGTISMKDFLKSKIKPKKGAIVNEEGKIIGHHDGAWYYTIGQRHGIGIGGGDAPYFVSRIDTKKNIVYVAKGQDNEDLFEKSLEFDTVNWIGEKPSTPFKCKARIRYRQPLQACTVTMQAKNNYVAEFVKSQRAVTPGQMIVLYQGNRMLGGGVIK